MSELHGRRGKEALLSALLDQARGVGSRLAIVTDEVWKEQSKLYAGQGFGHLERIVFFQKDLRAHQALELTRPLPLMEFSLCTTSDILTLIALDHDSFPWLWWNSEQEFEAYLQMPDVYAYVASLDGRPVGYASFTMYADWGHLDRLAVIASRQGSGFGAAQLQHALVGMYSLRASSVGLSTQFTNSRSHLLYRNFGFRQNSDAMDFYGLEL